MIMPELDLNTWIKPEDVDPEAELTFADAGKNTEISMGEGKDPKKAFEITVKFKNGETRAWTMNMTSQRAVATAYGSKTEAWVGKKVNLFVQTMNIRGTEKKVVFARVPK